MADGAELTLECDTYTATEFAKLQFAGGFKSLETFLIHLLHFSDCEETLLVPAGRVTKQCIYIHTTVEVAAKFNKLKVTSGFNSDISLIKHLLTLKKHQLDFKGGFNNGTVYGGSREILAAKDGGRGPEVGLAADCDELNGEFYKQENIEAMLEQKLVVDNDALVKGELGDFKNSSIKGLTVEDSSSIFLRECLQLVRKFNLDFAYIKISEVLEIFNKLSYHLTANNYGSIPVKCIVHRNSARMFLFGNPLGEPVTEVSGLEALIGQLDTNSRYLYCDGVEVLANMEATHGDRYHSTSCHYWNDKVCALVGRKQAGKWIRTCPPCKRVRETKSRQLERPSAFNDKNEFELSSRHQIRQLPRHLLEHKCRLVCAELRTTQMRLKRTEKILSRFLPIPANLVDETKDEERNQVSKEDLSSNVLPDIASDIAKDSLNLSPTNTDGRCVLLLKVDEVAAENGNDSVVQLESKMENGKGWHAALKTEPDDDDDERYCADIDAEMAEVADAKEDNEPSESGETVTEELALNTEHKVETKVAALIDVDCDDDLETTSDSTNVCLDCDKRFKSALGLQIHRKAIHLITDFVCALCSQWFVSQEMLDFHATSDGSHHQVNKSVICNCCTRPWSNSKRCQMHKRKIHGLFECVPCGFACMSLATLGRHCSQCTAIKNNRLACNQCFLLHPSRKNWLDHMEIVHKNFRCSLCDKNFTDRKLYSLHDICCRVKKEGMERGRYKSRIHSCHLCKKSFASKYNVTIHLKFTHFQVFCKGCCQFVKIADVKGHALKCRTKINCLLNCRRCDRSLISGTKCICLKTKYKCSKCPEVFRGLNNYRAHCKAAHRKVASQSHCKICDRRVVNLSEHIVSHLTVKTSRCRFCSHAFKSNRRAINHEIRVHPDQVENVGTALPPHMGIPSSSRNLEDSFACYQCDFNDPSVEKVKEHLLTHFKGESSCKFCGDGLTEDTFKGHMEIHIPAIFKCPKCKFMLNKTFCKQHKSCNETRLSYGAAFFAHRLQNGDTEFTCRHCDFATQATKSLHFHLRTVHNINRPVTNKVGHSAEILKCNLCNFTTFAKHSLQQHQQIRHSEKAQCTVCGNILGSNIGLRQHMNWVHGKRKKLRHSCHVCGKSVKLLRQHMDTHSEVRSKFVCSFCAKVFNSSTNLRSHEKLHTEIKPFACKTCGKCFAHKQNYSIHLRTHMVVRPFGCEICSKTFVEKRVLERHLKTHIK